MEALHQPIQLIGKTGGVCLIKRHSLEIFLYRYKGFCHIDLIKLWKKMPLLHGTYRDFSNSC